MERHWKTDFIISFLVLSIVFVVISFINFCHQFYVFCFSCFTSNKFKQTNKASHTFQSLLHQTLQTIEEIYSVHTYVQKKALVSFGWREKATLVCSLFWYKLNKMKISFSVFYMWCILKENRLQKSSKKIFCYSFVEKFWKFYKLFWVTFFWQSFGNTWIKKLQKISPLLYFIVAAKKFFLEFNNSYRTSVFNILYSIFGLSVTYNYHILVKEILIY